jgi:phosphate transport system substrate-binding protein
MLKKWRTASALMLLMVLGMIISACGSSTGGTTDSNVTPTPTGNTSAATCVTGKLQLSGSSALKPLLDPIADGYKGKCSGAEITVNAGGSTTGLNNVKDGSVDIGNSDVFADPAKFPGLVDHQVAVVVFSVVINSKVTGVDNLTAAQLKDIYTGKTKNWKEVGGNDLPIVPVSRESGSGTRQTFESYVLGTKEAIPAGSTNPSGKSNGEIAQAISSTDGSIGYVTTDFAKKNSLKAVKIDGVEDTDENVKNNTYKYWNIEHMYTKGEAKDLAKAFIDYTKSDDVESIRKDKGFIAIGAMSDAAIQAKQVKF